MIELSYLYFLDYGGSYRGLLEEMRNTLGWQSRDVVERAKVINGVDNYEGNEVIGRSIWLEQEL
jgi:hypothetical protein